MMKNFIVVAFIGLTGLASESRAQSPKPDPDLSAALTAAGLKYSVSPSGTFEITMRTEAPTASNPGRAQVVYINSDRYENIFGGYRLVFTMAARLPSQPSSEMANALLMENGALPAGVWHTVKSLSGDAILVGFAVSVPLNASPQVLRTVIDYVAGEGDKMEKQLLGTDTR